MIFCQLLLNVISTAIAVSLVHMVKLILTLRIRNHFVHLESESAQFGHVELCAALHWLDRHNASVLLLRLKR